MSDKELQHRMEYAAFRALSGLLGILPERVASGLGAALGWLAGSILRIRRADVDRHLARAFADRTPRWRRRVARASYVHLGREAVAMFRMAGLDTEDVLERTTLDGFEDMREAVEKHGGAVLITGHLGNWEIGGAGVAARGLPLDAVAKMQANDRFNRALVRTRQRLGMTVVDARVANRAIPRSLKSGRVAALVADQNANEAGVFVPFFGRLASTARGPALFAIRRRVPVFVAAALRQPGWPPRYRAELRRIELERTGDLEEDVRRLTAAHVAALEEEVREAPEQYFWQHKRWKTRPPEEPA